MSLSLTGRRAGLAGPSSVPWHQPGWRPRWPTVPRRLISPARRLLTSPVPGPHHTRRTQSGCWLPTLELPALSPTPRWRVTVQPWENQPPPLPRARTPPPHGSINPSHLPSGVTLLATLTHTAHLFLPLSSCLRAGPPTEAPLPDSAASSPGCPPPMLLPH